MHLPGEVTAAIAVKVRALDGRETTTAQTVGNALYGLQSMGDSQEVRELVAALTVKVQECGEQLKAQEVGNALYGLQSMCDSQEVRELVAALTAKVRECERLDE